MAREKGMGSLQLEKSGRWTLRVGMGGKRFSRSTGTRDREQAERFAQRFLSPYGLGAKRLPLSEVWFEYERSPKRRDLAKTTLTAKRQIWMHFANWMERSHLEVSQLNQLTADMVGEYLRCLRIDHCATTYNNHVCVLREICRTLSEKACLVEDPWEGVRLLADDSHSRREFSLDELSRILQSAKKFDQSQPPFANPQPPTATHQSTPPNYHLLFLVGIYTGLRLGDCCMLEWRNVNLERKVIQVIPRKTRKYAHGHPVTIPIHPVLFQTLKTHQASSNSPAFVLPMLADWYLHAKWHVGEGLKRIFAAAGIVTSVKVEGRRYKAPEATFHSLRHTFVSLAANAGAPLAVVQSIVGHTSTAMTRHYYHENETELWQAVEAIPAITDCSGDESPVPPVSPAVGDVARSVGERLRELASLVSSGMITHREYKQARARILAGI